MAELIYSVTGMTCGHCVAAVEQAIGELAGVTEVKVDLDTGAVVVVADTELDTDAVRAAVADAGYELARAT